MLPYYKSLGVKGGGSHEWRPCDNHSELQIEAVALRERKGSLHRTDAPEEEKRPSLQLVHANCQTTVQRGVKLH